MAFPPLDALVPHGAPMILLDRLVASEGQTATCEVTVREGALFVEGGRVPSAVFLEYMAQAAAALSGLRSWRAGVPIRVGYLLGARELTLHVDGASVGERLMVDASIDWDDGTMAIYQTEVRSTDGRTLATALINVFYGSIEEIPA